MVYFTPTGAIGWRNSVSEDTGQGSLFSQSATNNGFIPTHLGFGSYAIYEVAVGLCWASYQLGYDDATGIWYEAVATVATSDERTYIPTHIHSTSISTNSSRPQGALFCVLSTHDAHERVKFQWSWPCQPVLNQAPTVVLDTDDTVIVMFFGTETDSSNVDRMFLYALRDSTKSKTMPTLLWRKPISPSRLGIMVERTTGNVGAWLYDSSTNNLLFLKLSTGDIIRTIDLNTLGISKSPISFGTLGVSSAGNTILIACFETISQNISTHREKKYSDAVVVAIDLSNSKVLWRFVDATTGQFVPMTDDKTPLLVYKNTRNIIQAIG